MPLYQNICKVIYSSVEKCTCYRIQVKLRHGCQIRWNTKTLNKISAVGLFVIFSICNASFSQLPVVMRVPRLLAWAQNLCMMQFSILGYGDIIVPGKDIDALTVHLYTTAYMCEHFCVQTLVRHMKQFLTMC